MNVWQHAGLKPEVNKNKTNDDDNNNENVDRRAMQEAKDVWLYDAARCHRRWTKLTNNIHNYNKNETFVVVFFFLRVLFCFWSGEITKRVANKKKFLVTIFTCNVIVSCKMLTRLTVDDPQQKYWMRVFPKVRFFTNAHERYGSLNVYECMRMLDESTPIHIENGTEHEDIHKETLSQCGYKCMQYRRSTQHYLLSQMNSLSPSHSLSICTKYAHYKPIPEKCGPCLRIPFTQYRLHSLQHS